MIYPRMVDEAQAQGKKIIIISDLLKEKVQNLVDINGNKIPELKNFLSEYNDNFEYNFVDSSQFSDMESKVFNKTGEILSLIGGKPKIVKEVLISETLQKNMLSNIEHLGQ